MESYNLKHHIVEHDARFELAQEISAEAKNTKSGKEPRWSALIKNELFGKLIKLARHAEREYGVRSQAGDGENSSVCIS